MNKRIDRELVMDLIALAFGLIAVVFGVIYGIVLNRPAASGVKASEIPASAQTLTGVAAGRNGDVAVEVIADENKIYQVKVIGHQETEGIGSVAAEKLPAVIFGAQSVEVDAISGATITSEAIKAAVANALASGGISADRFGSASGTVKLAAKKVETHSGVTVIHASEWQEKYPNEYNTWAMTAESDEIEDYLESYPMLRTLYEGYGFAIDYGSARGHPT